jgi:ABC-type uncharacterized transport system permease subunit
MGDEMYQLFFPVAIVVVITIVLVVVLLVLRERASARRQRISASAFFEAQDPRWAATVSEHDAVSSGGSRRPH